MIEVNIFREIKNYGDDRVTTICLGIYDIEILEDGCRLATWVRNIDVNPLKLKLNPDYLFYYLDPTLSGMNLNIDRERDPQLKQEIEKLEALLVEKYGWVDGFIQPSEYWVLEPGVCKV